MKIFILAFCIFQITLAQVRLAKLPRQGPVVASEPATRRQHGESKIPNPVPVLNKFSKVNDGFKAAQTASQQLVTQVNFVLDRNGQLPEVVIGYATYFFDVLTTSLSMLSGFPGDEKLRNYLAEDLNDVKVIVEALCKAGISLETIAAFVIFNLYADVMSGLNGLAKNKNSGVTRVVIPRASLPANLNIPDDVSDETNQQMLDGFTKLIFAAKESKSYKRLFIKNYHHFEGVVSAFFNQLKGNGGNLIGALSVRGTAAQQIGKAVDTLLNELLGAFAHLVQCGIPAGEIMWHIIQFGVSSISRSLLELILAV